MEFNGKEQPQMLTPPLLGSCRLNMSLVMLLGLFVTMFAAENTGMTIVCMNQSYNYSRTSLVNPHMINSTDSTSNMQSQSGSSTQQDKDIFWDKTTQGMLISLGYYGVLCHLPVGYLCDKFGRNKLTMITGMAVNTIVSLLSPVVITHLGTSYFFVLRFIIGVSNAFVVCPILPLLAHWSDPKDQGLLIGLCYAGFNIGNVAINPMIGLLCEYTGWEYIFYAAGFFCFLWVVLCYYMIYDTPMKHPRVSVEEKQYLFAYASSKKNQESKVSIPWCKILTCIPVWSVVISNFFFFAGMKGIKVTLPLYIKEALGSSITENGIFSAIPSVGALVVHFLMGPLFDYVRAKTTLSLTVIRKVFHIIGSVGSAAMAFAVSQMASDEKYLIISLITIGISLTEVTLMGGSYFALINIAPEFVGVLQGASNTIGWSTAFIVPMITSALTPNASEEEWSHVFIMFGGVFAMAGLVFTVTGSAKHQRWAKANKQTDYQR